MERKERDWTRCPREAPRQSDSDIRAHQLEREAAARRAKESNKGKETEEHTEGEGNISAMLMLEVEPCWRERLWEERRGKRSETTDARNGKNEVCLAGNCSWKAKPWKDQCVKIDPMENKNPTLLHLDPFWHRNQNNLVTACLKRTFLLLPSVAKCGSGLTPKEVGDRLWAAHETSAHLQG